MIAYEWSTRRKRSSNIEISLNMRFDQDEIKDLLSRYTPGQPVNNDDAIALFTEFINVAYENRDNEPQEV